MAKIELLGEDNFISTMNTENKAWRREHVSQGVFNSFDGTKMNYYYAIPDSAKRAIVIVHGFCEFWAKFHEYAWYLYEAGYAVFFMEQRGHGYSGGKLKAPDIVYIDNYNTYVEDLHVFVEKIVVPNASSMKKTILAHSMGGAVSTLFLEKYPQYFDSAILSSPMLKMKNNTSPILIKLLGIYAFLFGKKKALAPGQKRFDRKPVFETSSAMSKPRYDYMFERRLKDEHYQTYGASIGWALASLKTNKVIMKNADKLQIPITVFTAGNDHLIDPEGYRQFEKLVPSAKFINFDESKHEIFNAKENIRKEYFSDVLEILERL